MAQGDITQKFGTSNQAITVTVASLGNNAARESANTDNSSNLFVDALIQLKLKTAAAGVSATGYVNVYAYGSADGGTIFSGGASGADAAITLTSPPNFYLIGAFNLVANATTYFSPLFSVALAFNNKLPQRWGIVIENKTGAALDATAGNHSVFYQGLYYFVTP